MNPYRNYPPYPRRSSIPTPVFLSGLAAIGAGVTAGYADYANAPLVAPYLDGITRHAFLWIPALQSLPDEAWWAVSGTAAGVSVFVACMIAWALFGNPGSGSRGRVESELRKRAQRAEKDHWAGFNS
jgi:hypothetical protein